MTPRLDIRDYIADADYLVQLSDTEAWSYSVLESLSLGTPVITTPIPCF
jgi:glycosyltransferase involved in cell wall biosynthesis